MTIVQGALLTEARDVLSLISGAASAAPDALALCDGEEAFTRGELAQLVVGYAEFLTRAGVGPGDVVLVEIPRSWQEVVAVLGVLRAGACYGAIDASAPAARAEQMLAACSPAFVIGSQPRAHELGRLAPCSVLEPPSRGLLQIQTALPALPLDPGSAACLYFTSGSTGHPKAVSLPHSAVTRLVAGAASYTTTGPGERFMRLAPLAFDASTFEILVPLCTGATLVVFPAGPFDSSELSEFLGRRRITVAFLTAGLLRVVVEETPAAFASVKQLLTGGEVVSAHHVRAILDRYQGSLIVTNCYGPTENSTITTTHTFRTTSDATDPLPIGAPVPGTGVAIVDAALNPVRPGESGELLISGAGLASAYLGEPRLTAGAFIDHPTLGERMYRSGDLARWEHGVLEFLGRADRQVKIRGYRVELTEVESALRSQPSVRDAAVAMAPGTYSGGLVGAVVATQQGHFDANSLRASIRELLPDYMVPAVLVELDALPLTSNGKVDLERVAALERPPASSGLRTNDVLDDTDADVEKCVAACWSEVLGHRDFEHDEGFFDVGGDSLSATKLLGELRTRFPSVEIRIVDIFNYPSVNSFSAFIDEATGRTAKV